MKVLILIYLSSILFLSGSIKLPFENQYDSRELLFSLERPHQFDETSISPFEVIFPTGFRAQPTVIYCISGYEGTY